MFENIECPKPAYDRIKKSGLDNLIAKNMEIAHEILLYRSIYEGRGEKTVKWAEDIVAQGTTNNAELSLAKGITELRDIFDQKDSLLMDNEFNQDLANNPSFLAYLVLGDKIFHPRQFGFSDIRKLEEAVASFCIGEEDTFERYGHKRIWRGNNGNTKNEIYRNEHGDLYVSQTDVSGKDIIEKTLFGDEEVFDTVKIVSSKKAIYGYQDWSEFLASLLKYSRIIGSNNIPEIVKWRETLESIGGGVGGNYAEAFGMSDSMAKMNVEFMMKRQMFVERQELKELPFLMSGKEVSQVPIVRGRKLYFLREEKEGNIVIPLKYFKDRKFSEQVVYDEHDLPEALKGAYKYFARDRSKLPLIMDYFLKEKD